jgi:multiple sugar transport system ATP-binding protein
MVGITVRHQGVPVLDDLDLELRRGEFLVVAGPSGSGKTTLLRVIAGLQAPSLGSVWFDDQNVTALPPARREVAMVFQEHALYPTRTVERNIAFPLEARRVPSEERHRRAVEEARSVGVEMLLERYPGQLAAGHRQAVATARALIKGSTVLLMDEPLAHLDARARSKARVELRRSHGDLETSVVYVTNDQAEAMALGDRIALLDAGRVRQIGEPMELYHRPVDRFVAEFLGSPPMRIVSGELVGGADDLHLVIGTDRIELEKRGASYRPGLGDFIGLPIAVGIRPEALGPAGPSDPFNVCLHATVVGLTDHGYERYVELSLGSAGAVVARFPAGTAPAAGDPVEVAVDTARLGFFDPVTGRAIG